MLGTSFIPNSGSQTQKIPPITSVIQRSVKSVAGKYFDLAENKINPKQTKKPCSADKEESFKDIKILSLFINSSIIARAAQKIPAIDTVVNLGVFFLHLKDTVKPAKPKEESKPFINPNKVPSPMLSNDINMIPHAAIIIEINVVLEIFSLKKI